MIYERKVELAYKARNLERHNRLRESFKIRNPDLEKYTFEQDPREYGQSEKFR